MQYDNFGFWFDLVSNQTHLIRGCVLDDKINIESLVGVIMILWLYKKMFTNFRLTKIVKWWLFFPPFLFAQQRIWKKNKCWQFWLLLNLVAGYMGYTILFYLFTCVFFPIIFKAISLLFICLILQKKGFNRILLRDHKVSPTLLHF